MFLFRIPYSIPSFSVAIPVPFRVLVCTHGVHMSRDEQRLLALIIVYCTWALQSRINFVFIYRTQVVFIGSKTLWFYFFYLLLDVIL